jgi:hypothetical protein
MDRIKKAGLGPALLIYCENVLFFVAVVLDLFTDTGSFTGTLTQVEQLGTANDTNFIHHDLVDERRGDRENTLHADTVTHLTHGERSGRSFVFALDHHAIELLDTLFIPLFDLVGNGYGVSRFERRMFVFRGQLCLNEI